LKDDFVDDLNRFEALNRRTFELSSRISMSSSSSSPRSLSNAFAKGDIFGSIEALGALGPTLLGIAPSFLCSPERDKHFF
jgi:hypothetical protein